MILAAALLLLPLPSAAAVNAAGPPDKWSLYSRAAKAASQKQDYDSAEHYLKLALVESKQFGPADLRVADTLEDLGNVFMAEKKWTDAEESLKLCLRLREESVGPKSERVAMVLQRMGDLYARKNDFSAAANCYSREVNILEKKYGPNHRYLSLPNLKLAKVYDRERLYEWAENAGRKALKVRQFYVGDDNPNLSEELETLGQICVHEGKLAEAEQYLKQAVSLTEGGLRPNDPAKLPPLTALANLYVSQNKLDLARPLMEKAASLAATSKDNCLVSIQMLEGELKSSLAAKDYDGADNIYKRLVPMARGCPKFSPNEFRLFTVAIGMQLYNSQQTAHAEKYLAEGLAMDPEKENEDQAGLLGALGVCQNTRGDHAAACQTFEKMYKVSIKFPGQDNLVRAAAANALAGVSYELNKLSDAERYYKDAADIYTKRSDFPAAKPCFKSYSEVLTRLGKNTEAAKFLQMSTSK
jgi:tetratricopeptide (TPR) repeat protein